MNDSNNEEDEGKELLKLSQPIYFEPISSLTNVFFDVDNQQILSYNHNEHTLFGSGKDDGELLWKSLIRQAVLNNFLFKILIS
jgi:hypothetical protein